MGKDIHEDIFDEATITKLEIFEAYAQAWLPVFLYSPHFKKIHIFDFFAGSGHDPLHTPGSPLRFLKKTFII